MAIGQPTAANPSSTVPPLKLERDLTAEQRNLQRFLAENPNANLNANPEDRARAETFINVNTYGTSRPTFASQFGIPQLQEQVSQRDPFAFLSSVAKEAEAQRPTGVDMAAIESRIANIKDPRVKERVRNVIRRTRGTATQALLNRAENLYNQQTGTLQDQLATQLELFGSAREQASSAEQERRAQEAEEREFQRRLQLENLRASLSGSGSRGGDGDGRDGGKEDELEALLKLLGLDGNDGTQTETGAPGNLLGSILTPSALAQIKEKGIDPSVTVPKNELDFLKESLLPIQKISTVPYEYIRDVGIGPKPLNFIKRANGGPLNANQPAIVGERGPEVFVPSQPGVVIPNEALQSSAAEFPLDDADLQLFEEAAGLR